MYRKQHWKIQQPSFCSVEDRCISRSGIKKNVISLYGKSWDCLPAMFALLLVQCFLNLVSQQWNKLIGYILHSSRSSFASHSWHWGDRDKKNCCQYWNSHHLLCHEEQSLVSDLGVLWPLPWYVKVWQAYFWGWK